MTVTIESKNKTLTISATKEQTGVLLNCSNHKEPLKIPIFAQDSDINDYRFREKEQDFYRELEATLSAHPILKTLRELSTPMLLGIERKGRDLFPQDEPFPFHSTMRRQRNVFSNSLTNSLVEAATLAERSYNRIQFAQRDLTEKFSAKYYPKCFKI
jgi:hypothetical protein